MRLDYFLTLDPKVLAWRYASITGVRMLWWFLLTYKPGEALQALLPAPWSIITNVLTFVGFLSTPDRLGGGIPWLVDAVLAACQLGLLAGIARWAATVYAPHSLPDMLRPDPEASQVDGTRILRPWWLTPALMTLSITAILYLIPAMLIASTMSSQWRPLVPINGMASLGFVPLIIGMTLGAFGLLSGVRFNASAAHAMESDFQLKYVEGDHALAQRVNTMGTRLNLPPLKVGVMNAVNAFAMGSTIKEASVVIGVPLLKHLKQEEVDAIIGHELGHVVAGDVRRMQFAEGFQRMFTGLFVGMTAMATVAGTSMASNRQNAALGRMFGQLIGQLGRWILSLGGELMVKGLSRNREYYADAVGAALTSPAAMISALKKLHEIPAEPTEAEQNYGYLMFKGEWGWLLATHPTLEQRVKALEEGSYIRALPRKAVTAAVAEAA